jgi:hypothetical protein
MIDEIKGMFSPDGLRAQLRIVPILALIQFCLDHDKSLTYNLISFVVMYICVIFAASFLIKVGKKIE